MLNRDQKCYLFLQKLEFTLGGQEPKSPDAKPLLIEQIQKELDQLIITKRASNEIVFDWIEVCTSTCDRKDLRGL